MSNPTEKQAQAAAIIAQYRAELERQSYVRGSINVYLRSIRRFFQLMDEQGVALGGLTPAVATDLVRRAQWRCDRKQYAVFIVKRFVEYLSARGIAKPPAPPTPAEMARAALRRDYADYLHRQRGLSQRSILHAWRFADRFLDHRFGDGDIDLAATTAGDVIAFLQHLLSRKTPYRDKTASAHLRSFLQYLFKTGATATNLALCVPRVAQPRGTRLPRHLTPDQVEAVLAAVRANPRHGRRDYAMLLLMARLGLRAPEVIAIQLDDIDWRAGELLVRGKGQRHDHVPIPPDVGEALAAYVRHDRISASRALFVSLRAPNGPFKDGQVVNAILKDAFAATGVKPPSPYVGSHVLRHSLATNMVRQGASLAEVGDVLRHRSRASTMIYAKLDIDGLRSIAQPWPAAGGVR